MVFEAKADVQLQAFFLQLPILICIRARGVWGWCIYGLMRHHCRSRTLFTGRNELLQAFFFLFCSVSVDTVCEF